MTDVDPDADPDAQYLDTPDPTGARPDQMKAKAVSVQLGDQDAENLTDAYNPPPGADIPTAQNVRRYPELFSQEVIDSFNVDEAADANAALTDDNAIEDDDDSFTQHIPVNTADESSTTIRSEG